MSTELAWAAGFFEGEGCVSSARPKKRLRIRAAVTQNGPHAPQILQRFVSAVGQGRVLGPYDYAGRYANSPTKQSRYVIQYQTERAVGDLMYALRPYLTNDSPKWRRYIELSAEARHEEGGEQPS